MNRCALSMLLLAVSACGSRTDIQVDLAPQAHDASFDATADADAPAEASTDAPVDGPMCRHRSTCDIVTCPKGCCSGDKCLPGTDLANCGTHGETCSSCPAGGFNACDPVRHVCTKPVLSCQVCSCCDQGTGSPRCSQTGVAGSCETFACAACAPGLACQNGFCF